MFLRSTLVGVMAGQQLFLDGEEGRHAGRVRRAQPAEQLLVGDGRGTVCHCQVVAVLADRVQLQVIQVVVIEAPQPSVTVVQALAKGDRAELAVELLTELGADTVIPWQADRSVSRWHDERASKGQQRWQRTARESAKQSRRAWVPVVEPLVDAGAVALRLRRAALAILLDSDPQQPTISIDALPVPGSGEVVMVVGPEGGISTAERLAFTDAGALPVRLGSPVLRTSTAGAAALAALSSPLGRWV